MTKHKLKILVIAVLSAQYVFGQSSAKIFTSDIDNFCTTCDKVIKLNDTIEQKSIIKLES